MCGLCLENLPLNSNFTKVEPEHGFVWYVLLFSACGSWSLYAVKIGHGATSAKLSTHENWQITEKARVKEVDDSVCGCVKFFWIHKTLESWRLNFLALPMLSSSYSPRRAAWAGIAVSVLKIMGIGRLFSMGSDTNRPCPKASHHDLWKSFP